MYFAVAKFNFEPDSVEGITDKEVKSLCEKLRKRFPICVLPTSQVYSSDFSLAMTLLNRSQEKLNKILDEVSDFCEESGFGRVDSEVTLMDHLDNIEDHEHDE